MQDATLKPFESVIDLKAVLEALWNKKRIFLIGAIAISFVFWVVVLGMSLLKPKIVTFTKQIQLTFPQVEKDTYPNETPFNIFDLITPVVLNQIYEKNKLGDFKLSREAFLQAIGISAYSHAEALILKKYQLIAERKGVIASELSEAQERLQNELKNSRLGKVEIRFILREALNFPKTLAEKVLQDIPKTWANFSIEKRGVLKLNASFYSERLIDLNTMQSLDYLLMDHLLREKIKNLESNLQALKILPNWNMIQDEQTGFTLPELQQAISELERYEIAEVMEPIRTFAIAKRPETMKLFFERRLRELTWQRDELIQKADIVKEAYRAYVQQDMAFKTNLPTHKEQVVSEGGKDMTITAPQFTLTDGFLDKFVKLSNQVEDLTYRKTLNSRSMEYREQAVTIETDIARMQDTLSMLNNRQAEGSETHKIHIELVERKMPEILDKLKSYTRITGNIAQKLSLENFGSIGLLFKDNGGVGMIEDRGMTLKRAMLWYLFLLSTAVLLAIAGIIVREIWQKQG